VTSIVNNFAESGKIDRMVAAAVKIGPKYRGEWNESGTRGRRIHGNISDWAEGRATDIQRSDEPFMAGVASFIKATRPHWLASERDIVWSAGVGGRFDLIGELTEWDRDVEGVKLPAGDISGFWLIDGKTGKHYHTALELQLAGYAGADGMIIYDKDGKAVDIEPLPYVERWGGLYLNENGEAELVEVAPTDAEKALAIRAFLAQLQVRLWADLVGERA
jgi:hypothetical protein